MRAMCAKKLSDYRSEAQSRFAHGIRWIQQFKPIALIGDRQRRTTDCTSQMRKWLINQLKLRAMSDSEPHIVVVP